MIMIFPTSSLVSFLYAHIAKSMPSFSNSYEINVNISNLKKELETLAATQQQLPAMPCEC